TTCTWTPFGSPIPLLTLNRDHTLCPAPGGPLSPWSAPPHCPAPSNAALGGELPTDCVFTHASFRGGEGLSLITTPELAASVAGFLDDAAVPSWLRDHPSRAAEPRRRPYVVKDLPGRGKGVVARQGFRKHEAVMVGFPVLFARLDFVNSAHFGESQIRRMFQRAVNQLSAEKKTEILALSRSTGGADLIRDVMKTNGFAIDIGGVQHMTLFTEGSRVNHACRPNTFWRYSNRHMAMEVVALRDIQPGEEITHACK
ncbi:hypothetical protein B0H67DRAFT_463373, partial [Lasiosphaeris hirsuta]